jgi:hypothetical protein
MQSQASTNPWIHGSRLREAAGLLREGHFPAVPAYIRLALDVAHAPLCPLHLRLAAALLAWRANEASTVGACCLASGGHVSLP